MPRPKSIAMARHKTQFLTPSRAAYLDAGRKALAEKHQLNRTLKLAEQIGGRDTEAEVVEHIPAPAVYVPPSVQRALQDREWVGPTQTNRLTGEISHMRRVRRGGAFVTERFDGPAP